MEVATQEIVQALDNLTSAVNTASTYLSIQLMCICLVLVVISFVMRGRNK